MVQTLSRRDSLKSRHLETELANVKDDFERLKLEHESTRQHIAAMDVRINSRAVNEPSRSFMVP